MSIIWRTLCGLTMFVALVTGLPQVVQLSLFCFKIAYYTTKQQVITLEEPNSGTMFEAVSDSPG